MAMVVVDFLAALALCVAPSAGTRPTDRRPSKGHACSQQSLEAQKEEAAAVAAQQLKAEVAVAAADQVPLEAAVVGLEWMRTELACLLLALARQHSTHHIALPLPTRCTKVGEEVVVVGQSCQKPETCSAEAVDMSLHLEAVQLRVE